MPDKLSGLLFHATGTPPWLLRPVKISTSSKLYPDYFRLPTFLDCPGIQFFDSPFFQHSQLGCFFFTCPSLCSTCVTYGTLCHAIDHQMLPTQSLPRKAEDFPTGDKYLKHVPLLTYLIYFSPKGVYMVGPIYVLESPHRALISA